MNGNAFAPVPSSILSFFHNFLPQIVISFDLISVVDCGGKSVTTQIGCHPMFFEENFDSAPRAPWVKKLAVLYQLNQLAEEYVYSFNWQIKV